MTNYRRGSDLERAVRKYRDEEGALLTIRSAGSRGRVDVLAIFPGRIELIQGKTNGLISPQDRVLLCELATIIQKELEVQTVAYLAYKKGSGLIMKALA